MNSGRVPDVGCLFSLAVGNFPDNVWDFSGAVVRRRYLRFWLSGFDEQGMFNPSGLAYLEFPRQRLLGNWPAFVKTPHVLQVSTRETTSEPLGQIGREPLDELRPVGGTFLAALLDLDDPPTDLPVGDGHDAVDRTNRRAPGCLQQGDDLSEQAVVIGCGNQGAGAQNVAFRHKSWGVGRSGTETG